MIQEFQNIALFPITLADILANLAVALVCGLFISWVYRKTYKGPGYAMSFVNSIVLLSMITAIVLMVIGNNLARAFGLVGAMSIIRFRTAVKETQDIVFIFFSLAIGMAAGVGYHLIAISSTLIIGALCFVIAGLTPDAAGRKEYLLQFSFRGTEDAPPYLPVMQQYCRSHKTINVRTNGLSDEMELSFYVRLKNQDKNNDFIRELSKTDGVRNINLFFDEAQI